MVEEFVHIENQLAEWRRWVFSGTTTDLGYPKATLEARAMKEGLNAGTKTTGPRHVTESNPVAERMETLVVSMPKDLRRAIKSRYLHLDSERDGGRRLGMSRADYRMVVRIGLGWLDGHIRAMENPALATAQGRG